jgi:hypothetical protein
VQASLAQRLRCLRRAWHSTGLRGSESEIRRRGDQCDHGVALPVPSFPARRLDVTRRSTPARAGRRSRR